MISGTRDKNWDKLVPYDAKRAPAADARVNIVGSLSLIEAPQSDRRPRRVMFASGGIVHGILASPENGGRPLPRRPKSHESGTPFESVCEVIDAPKTKQYRCVPSPSYSVRLILRAPEKPVV